MKKVLVTGAGGFIGSHLTEELVKKGYQVRAFVRYNSRNNWGHLESLDKSILDHIEIMSGDITDPFFVDKAVEGTDAVFHLAALIAIPYSYVAPENFVNVNINGTLNILKAALNHNVARVIHTSTSETYGTALYTPINEQHPLQAQSPYAATKIGADKLAESFHLSFGLPVSIVRPFNTYGPRQSARAIIPTFISQMLSEQNFIKVGSLHPVRDFTFVKDTVNGFISAAMAEGSIGKVTNLGSGSGISIGDLAKKIKIILGKEKDIIIDDQRIRPENSEVLKLICDNSMAKNILGWSPAYSIDEGLGKTIDYIKDNLKFYKTNIYNI